MKDEENSFYRKGTDDMRQKFAAITLGLVLGAVTISGCNGTNTSGAGGAASKESADDKIYGEVKK